MVIISVVYEGDLRCRSEHGPSRTVLATDAPVDNQGRGESFSPTDLVATALATCMLTTMGIAARRDGVQLAGATVRIEKHMSSEPPRRIARLAVALHMPPGIPVDRRAALERAAHGCPVVRSLHPDLQLDIAIVYPEQV